MARTDQRDSGPTARMIQVRNLRVQLPCFTLSVDEFSAGSGELVAVSGPNGSGKSTFLQVIANRRHWYSGKVVRTRPGATVSGWELTVGYVDNQAKFIEDMRVAEILTLCSCAVVGWQDERCRSLVATLELDAGKEVRALSSGNRAKLSLVIAISQQPHLLVLDEPFAFLDVRCRDALAAVISDCKANGSCVFIASHDFNPVAAAVDTVVAFEDGCGIVASALAEAESPCKPEDRA